MLYRKEGKIGCRVIKHCDVRAIASLFEELAEHDGGDCSFDIKFYDSTSVSDNHASVFDSSFFCRRDVKSIWFSYKSQDYSNELMLRTAEVLQYSEVYNAYELRSSDEVWFNSSSAKLSDLLGTIKKRHWLRKILTFPWIFLVFILYQTVLSYRIMPLLGFEYGLKPDNLVEETYVFIPILGYIAISAIIYFSLTSALHFLYPETEFAFGSLRYERRLKMRNALGWIMTAIIVPLLLSILA